MKIECTLSAQSFRDAAEKVRQYRDSLNAKCEEFCNQVAHVGFSVISYVLSEHYDTGATLDSLTIEETEKNGVYKATVRVTSDAIMFLEFGTGLVGQGTAPHAGNYDKPYGSGTFPGQGHWDDPGGWWYYNGWGKKAHTWGMAASMPMYRGGKEMERVFRQIARKVFSDG